MNCRKRMKSAGSPNAHMKPAQSREGNGVQSKGDKHGMERASMPMPPKDKSGSVAKWS